MNRPKIVIIGGGSVGWAPLLVRDILLKPALANAELWLYDIDAAAVKLTREFATKLAKQLGVNPTIIGSTDRAKSFRNANYFIITISTGGFKSMTHDLAIPEKYGIFHTVGDTAGPGGWARLIRNFDVFTSLARDINRFAPRAVVLNYSNPMTTLTTILSRLCNGPVVGLCHGLFDTLDLIKDVYRLGSTDEIAADYAGVNHFFFMTRATACGRDVVADLKRKVAHRSLDDLIHEAHQDALGFSSPHMAVATELLRLTGTIPFAADRHTCEFLPWCITSRAAVRRYQLVRTTIAERQRRALKARRQLSAMVNGEIPVQFLQRSRETAADIMETHLRGGAFLGVGNLPNIGQVSNLPVGTIVETAMRVDGNGFSPIAYGSLPTPVLELVEPVARSLTLTVDACFARSREMAFGALRLDPLCAHLRTDQVNDLGRRLLAAHQKFIQVF